MEKILKTDFYTEGPVVDRNGNIYFTTLAGGSIMKWDGNSEPVIWAKANQPNGQFILSNGDHLICDSALGRVLRFSSEGMYIADETGVTCAGFKVNVPNDLVVDAQGNLYFTDSIRHSGSVFFVGVNKQELLFAGELDYPNGLVISNDGKKLFVAESYRNRILSINLEEEKKTCEVFADLPAHDSGDPASNLPDGLAINSAGEIAVAHYGMKSVQLLSPNGTLLATYETIMPCTSNVFFMDDDRLLVTGGFGEPGPGAVMIIKIR